jgi:uncharacterized protein with HEPN domain
MSKRSALLLLGDILDACLKIQNYTVDFTYEEFSKHEMVIDAVIRNFEIIGEAANRLPEDFKDNHPEIDWHRIRGFRNRIVHDYFGVDLSILWKIKNENLPTIIEKIEILLDQK